jgi:uncharacterized protein YndB with AHSA1/START domain
MTKTQKTAATFRLAYAVRTDIRASPDAVWRKLTDARAFPQWNSTVTSIEGEIAEGKRLVIRVPNVDRAFKVTVSHVQPNQGMQWSDGMMPMFRGERTFTLTDNGNGTTTFSMQETFRGLMLPMIKGALPDFAPIFDKYAEDLKRACEA